LGFAGAESSTRLVNGLAVFPDVVVDTHGTKLLAAHGTVALFNVEFFARRGLYFSFRRFCHRRLSKSLEKILPNIGT